MKGINDSVGYYKKVWEVMTKEGSNFVYSVALISLYFVVMSLISMIILMFTLSGVKEGLQASDGMDALYLMGIFMGSLVLIAIISVLISLLIAPIYQIGVFMLTENLLNNRVEGFGTFKEKLIKRVKESYFAILKANILGGVVWVAISFILMILAMIIITLPISIVGYVLLIFLGIPSLIITTFKIYKDSSLPYFGTLREAWNKVYENKGWIIGYDVSAFVLLIIAGFIASIINSISSFFEGFPVISQLIELILALIGGVITTTAYIIAFSPLVEFSKKVR